jgi:16S rRNA processing protein RimM
MTESVERRVTIGRIVGVFGVKGWVKLESWTRPAENILAYRDWQVCHAAQWRPMRCVDGRPHGKGFVAQVADAAGQVCSDRDAASRLVGSEIAIDRAQMPALGAGEHYWADLIGFTVVHLDGQVLGELSDMLEFPAQDMMEVKGERRRLIPFVSGPIVRRVDVDARRIEVDWAPDL